MAVVSIWGVNQPIKELSVFQVNITIALLMEIEILKSNLIALNITPHFMQQNELQ